MDYEVSAATEAEIATYAEAIARKTDEGSTYHLGPGGYPIEGHLTDGTRYSIMYYGVKMTPTGELDVHGKPMYKRWPGVYAIMRWLPEKEGHTPPPDPSGEVTIIDLPEDSPHRFAD